MAITACNGNIPGRGKRLFAAVSNRLGLLCWALAVGLAAGVVRPALAAETFLGLKIDSLKGDYLVLKDANVRAKPNTKGKKIGSVIKGSRVKVVGRAKGGASWLAVQKGGKEFGFVYAPIMVALIDGSLKKNIKGKVSLESGLVCNYTVHFEGKTSVEGELFEVSDYDVICRCRLKGQEFNFLAPTFLAEAPYDFSQKQAYQISVDVLGIGDGYDEIFSTTFIFHRDKKIVVFDNISLSRYGNPPAQEKLPAKTVPQALTAAIRIAFGAWNDKVWQILAASGVREVR
ncbi:MAG: SH3 domain-containing protein [Rhodospirillales bacterium]|jgi:hypothetical protein|nr:SH3 domain-containing protein [Rhodospirillales bacterium]HIJ42366.1 SH3 domain-containing protein [Rhodospirillaceae bacterium]MDP7099177.1 SH3 domain-containing protein [Rhodospirillales bacterium]MDP7216276.1 SH3 domain-containing protein [Rhodospirillales bacterium]HIJ45013.1 SH3 domain-containing protein [Rhodospirillaceae bacterium]